MEAISQITPDTVRLPLDIPVQSYLRDHHVEGRVVLPAVEAMRFVGEAVKRLRPDAKINCMTCVRFDKFLYIPPGQKKVRVFVDIETHPDKDISARLLTKTRSEKSSITRVKEHAAIRYPQEKIRTPVVPLDLNSAIEGVCFEVPPEKIYKDLVPFGPGYHNIKAPLILSENGALAIVGAPSGQRGPDLGGGLGSPFHLDAAFHAACVWGQRYMGTFTFPMALETRTVFEPTRSGETYFGRVLPVRHESNQQLVDIWIYDAQGDLREHAGGVLMRDASAGRLRPPPWLIQNERQALLPHVRSRCRALSVIELRGMMPFAEKTLAPREKVRFQKMGPKRKPSYLAARLSCKRISRMLSGNDAHTPAADITTVGADSRHPRCPPTDSSAALGCSVAHDDRFAVALAAEGPVGIDVEKVSPRVLKSRNLYMAPTEQTLVRTSSLGEFEAAVRIWSAKEAAAKALDISLADAWRRVQMLEIGRNESRGQIDFQYDLFVAHDDVEGHIFSVACLPEIPPEEQHE